MLSSPIALARRALHIFHCRAPACPDDPMTCDPTYCIAAARVAEPRRKKTGNVVRPEIDLDVFLNHMKCFTSPSPDQQATVYAKDGARVGYVTYAMSPLFDMVYIFDIGIDEAFRRQGYALAVIRHLVLTYRMPLTTIKEVYAAHLFWAAARELAMLNDSSMSTISISEMNQEQARWEHLRPEMIRLENLIIQRFIQGESYESAVGRGLD
ncbi:GNAT family N-acetyltransferase [Massilia sp. P8910]|uniref:GNAT family N-acetyltransferase n=1 Tax=Massilia antarctica TaxID=2765360 RepID=UPI001E34E881|nr:GNAT family N-acetyltransferase [Massilia antarctica]MCE3602813.1 GNAT family N-acetyltransferase [Massilia antarctica]